jgi:hypothetical protein
VQRIYSGYFLTWARPTVRNLSGRIIATATWNEAMKKLGRVSKETRGTAVVPNKIEDLEERLPGNVYPA